jgi:hypothetical protein
MSDDELASAPIGGALDRREQTQPTVHTEPPVVARLVVEIRSDGRYTIARGALEDVTTGERTAIEARGATPVALVVALARTIRQLPSLARRAARAVLPARR